MSGHSQLADRFIKAFNGISAWLDRRLPPEVRDRGIAQFQRKLRAVSRTDPIVRSFSQDLEKFAYLRNALIHDEDYPERIVAEPHLEVVLRIESILQMLLATEAPGRNQIARAVPPAGPVPRTPGAPSTSKDFSPMVVHAWNNGSWHSTGAGYGIRLSRETRDRNFSRGWDKVTLVFGGSHTTEVSITSSFWEHVPTLRSADLGRWLIQSGLAPWTPGNPPELRFVRTGERVFTVDTM